MKIAKELKKLSDKYRESNFLRRQWSYAGTEPFTKRAFVSGKKGDA